MAADKHTVQPEQRNPDRAISGVYKITIGGHSYVGSSNHIQLRISSHIGDLIRKCHRNRPMQEEWDRTAGKGFGFEIIEVCDPLDRKDAEFRHTAAIEPDLNINRLRKDARTHLASAQSYRNIDVGGIVFPTTREAALHYGVSRASISRYMRTGKLPQSGSMRGPGSKAVPVEIDGVWYPSIKAAARSTGMDHHKVSQLAGRERIPERRKKARQRVLVDGATFESFRAASRHLGCHVSTVADRLRRGLIVAI